MKWAEKPSCFRILCSIKSSIFKLVLIELGILVLTDLLKNLSLFVPLPSWLTWLLIAKQISPKHISSNFSGDFLKTDFKL